MLCDPILYVANAAKPSRQPLVQTNFVEENLDVGVKTVAHDAVRHSTVAGDYILILELKCKE